MKKNVFSKKFVGWVPGTQQEELLTSEVISDEDFLALFEREEIEACGGELPGHSYTSNSCPQCGQEFCWQCCAASNEGEPYVKKNFRLCPRCGHDYFAS